MDPESRGDKRDRRLDVGNPVVDARCEARSPAEREHFVVPRDSIFRRSNKEDVGRKVGDVDGCPVRQRVITRESADESGKSEALSRGLESEVQTALDRYRQLGMDPRVAAKVLRRIADRMVIVAAGAIIEAEVEPVVEEGAA